VLFLEAVAVVGEQAGYVGLLDGIEELAADAAVESLPA
jgi:ribosomal protein S5